MSTKTDEVDDVCASCGIKGGDDIKLKKCTACKLVHYCSVACQKEHRSQHKRACKRRAAELREELLFKQPELSYLGECPICCLPLPLELRRSTQHSCCSKVVCGGCCYANRLREEEESLPKKCPFCRAPIPETHEEENAYIIKRAEANDPAAIHRVAIQHYHKKNYGSAFEFCKKAAQLGDIGAHCKVANLYADGRGVERDKKKETHHLEEAAIGGHPDARWTLGIYDGNMGNIEKSVKHFIIGANLGHDGSLEKLKEGFGMGFVKKEDLASALRAHKAVVDAAKSPQREEAERYYQVAITMR